MDNLMPKHLECMLDNLLRDNNLTSWTIQANSKMTTVIIRFQPQDTDILPQADTSVKYKRLPPSQIKRDSNRAERWKDTSKQVKEPVSLTPSHDDFDGTKQKTLNTTSSPILNTDNDPPYVNTRNRSKLSAKAASFKPSVSSPVPQVDGTTDRDHSMTTGSSSIQQDTEAKPMADWEKALYIKYSCGTNSPSSSSVDASGFG